MGIGVYNLPLRQLGFKTRRDERTIRILACILIAIFTLMAGLTLIAYATGGIPMTGFDEFDAMYRYHMEKESVLVDDIMVPVNEVVFFLIKIEMRILGSVLLLLSISSAAFAIWYAAKPDFADEVSEVKMRVANGEKIPVEEVKEFFLQFFPDIKANSGIADSYEYERPTIGMLLRDHLLKFIILFAIAIALMTNVITTFIVKTGNALAFGAKYYTENTDFVGIVNTVTTAGKDYPFLYDTLTTEGRNKKKLANAMYVALKDAKPRDRTTEFLNKIGAAVATEVSNLETGGDVLLGYQNFTATATIMEHDVQHDTSPVKLVKKYSIADTFGMVPGVDVDKDMYMYLTVIQYETAPDGGGSSPYGNQANNIIFNLDNNGVPTSISFANKYKNDIANGYKFTGTPPNDIVGRASFSDGSQTNSVNLTGKVSGNGSDYTIDLTALKNVYQKELSATKSLRSITISGMAKNVTLVKDGDANSKPLSPGSVTWTAK